MELRILGAGASMGVPVIGCRCAVCRSPDPRNQRLRTSAVVRGNATLLIDCGPDFRQQALNARLTMADGVLITHAHMDHIGGIDDLRGIAYGREKPLPILCHEHTARELQERYHYMLEGKGGKHPMLAVQAVQGDQGSVSFVGEQVEWIRYDQVGCTVLGYRIGPIAYLTDIKKLPKGLERFLQGVQLLVLSALQFETHDYFLSVTEAVELAQALNIPRTYLTHLSHVIDGVALAGQLPPGIELACDGAVYSAKLLH